MNSVPAFCITLWLMLICTTQIHSSSRSPREFDGYTYLGSFSSHFENEHHKSFYYASENAASWQMASVDCTNHLGPKATLVKIQTLEEGKALRGYLVKYHSFASQFWTNGQYIKGQWMWDTNEAISTDFHWSNDQPGNSLLKMSIWLPRSSDNVELRIEPQSETHRFVCELTCIKK